MRKIMLSLPNYLSRVPDQTLVLSDTNEPADGSRAGDKLVSGTRADGWAMVHLPYGGKVALDLKKALPGCKTGTMWRAWWVDTKCGAREMCGSGSVGVETTFGAETASSGTLKDDCLLLVEAFGV